MAKSVQQVVDKWAANAGGAQGAFTDGVNNTTVDVVGRAIAQESVLLQNFNQAVTSGRWAQSLTASGGTANWKAKTVAKASNYGTGIAAAKGKFQSAMTKLLPYIQQGQTMIEAMPSGSIAASKNRATAWIDYMAAGKGQFKG